MSRGVTSRVPRHARPAWTGPVLDPSAWLEDSFRARARDRHRAHENAPAGRCFLPATDRNIVKHRVQPSLTSSAADREQEIDRLLASGRAGPTSGRPALNPGPSWPILRKTSSASCPRRRRSSV